MAHNEDSGGSTMQQPPTSTQQPLHRVLIYTTCYNVMDGVTITIRKLEQEILSAGHHVCILTTKSGDPNNTNLDGVHDNRSVLFMDSALPIPFLEDSDNPGHTYQIGFSLSVNDRKRINSFDPTLLHITVPDCTSLHLITHARSRQIPIMGTYHSNIPEYMDHYAGLSWLKHPLGQFFRHQYNFLQALYVPTPYIQRHLMDTYQMDQVTDLKVWGRGVDVDVYNPAYRSLQYRRNLKVDDDTPIVLWVGRLVQEKRVDIFANVVRRLHAKRVKFHALVVGAGPSESEIKQLPNTTFAGWMSKEQLSTAYASADVFLFPSSVETFGNVTLEAAASGLPVVVESGCSGHLVREGENGYTCPAGDEDAFFESTLSLVEDAELRSSCSQTSREMALTLEKTAVVQQMIDNYTAVTSQFYSDYGGRHSNRDIAYTKQYSFVGGSYTRPLILIVVEKIFVGLLWLAFKSLRCCMWIKRHLGQQEDDTHPELAANLLPQPPTSTRPSKQEKAKQDAIDSAVITSSSLSQRSSCVSVVELSSDIKLDDSSKSRNQCKATHTIDDTDHQDDDTETTGNSTSLISQSPPSSCSTALGDSRMSHALIKAFVSWVMFQSRIECWIRQTVSSCFQVNECPTENPVEADVAPLTFPVAEEHVSAYEDTNDTANTLTVKIEQSYTTSKEAPSTPSRLVETNQDFAKDVLCSTPSPHRIVVRRTNTSLSSSTVSVH